MVEVKQRQPTEFVSNWLDSVAEFWGRAPDLFARFQDLDVIEQTLFLDDDFVMAKMHTDSLLKADLAPEQQARLDKVLAVRDEWTERLERLARGK